MIDNPLRNIDRQMDRCAWKPKHSYNCHLCWKHVGQKKILEALLSVAIIMLIQAFQFWNGMWMHLSILLYLFCFRLQQAEPRDQINFTQCSDCQKLSNQLHSCIFSCFLLFPSFGKFNLLIKLQWGEGKYWELILTAAKAVENISVPVLPKTSLLGMECSKVHWKLLFCSLCHGFTTQC